MPFQFLCPQGHLLQADEAHMGLQTQCPQCGMLFIIPTVVAPSHAAGAQPAGAQFPDMSALPAAEAPQSSPAEFFSLISGPTPADQSSTAGGSSPSFVAEPGPAPKIEAEPLILHIPCPNGHELETPVDMLGQNVLCPHCGAQFHLRREDSIEAQHERELREQRRGEAWFRWSIAAAVIVVIGLLAMIIIANQG
jgi:hypothetical protein